MGARLGRYTVLKHLASGGMADVLLARTEGIEGFARHVVLKRIRAEHAKDRRFIDMFLDEARLAGNLHHQNIVQVYDIGEADGEYFIAMEYLHGEDLRTMLSILGKTRTHMPLGVVASVISSVAAGLHHAHERRGPDKKPLNIVHRDVSPSNIFVGYDGSVKIVDFGIAKAAARQVETRSGSLKGKVSYMSPEQCKLGAIDRRSDVYALGVVLYELATTTRLFKSDSDYLVMDAICTGKFPLPRVRRPDLPNELSTIIMTALATDPERRYQTADEMRVALDAFAATGGLTASASSIAAYVHKLCGEKPEPWLDHGSADAGPGDDPTRDELAKADTETGTAAKTVSNGKSLPRASPAGPVVAGVDPRAATGEPGTSTRLGWEKTAPSADSRPVGRGLAPAKVAMLVVPLLAIAGVLAWKLAATPDAEPVAVVTATTTPVEPAASTTITPAPPAKPVDAATATPPATTAAPTTATTATTVAAKPPDPKAAKPADPKAAPTTATIAPTTAPPTAAKPSAPTATAAKPTDPKATTTATTTTTTATTTATAAKPTDPTPTTTAATVATPPDPKVATPPPDVTEPPMAVLAPAAVEAVAARNRKALLACENNETLTGDLTVRFEIDAGGRVVTSQLHSTLGKPKVASCILAAVKSWRFPKPATGSATGVYAISFQ